MLLTNDVVFDHWFPKNRWFKRKKTKTYGLEGLDAPLRQGRSFYSQPCPTKRPTATRQLVRQSFVFYLILLKKASQLIPNSRKQWVTNSRLITKYLREFGIKHCRYAFCCVALVGEKAISLPVQSCSGGMVSYPKLANQPFRRSYFHRSDNTLAKP